MKPINCRFASLFNVFFILALIGILYPKNVAAQNFPPCVGEDRSKWDKCIGTVKNNEIFTYTGDFREGKFSGKGSLLMGNGNRFTGDFFAGKFTGNGEVLIKPNAEGKGYFGEMRDGKFHGKGSLTLSPDIRYYGYLSEGSITGAGTLYIKNMRIEGNFEAGYPIGEAKIFYADGKSYVGTVKKLAPHGAGILFSDDRSVLYSGEWIDGKPQVPVARKGDGSDGDKTCQNYGLTVGTRDYADCRIRLDQVKLELEREARSAERLNQLQERERQARQEAADEARSDDLLRFGLNLMNSRSPSFMGGLADAANNTWGGSRGSSPSPSQPTSITRMISLPNGKTISCTSFQSMVSCF